MFYDYETEKTVIFTDKGQRMLLSIRDEAFRLISLAGAVRLDKLIAKQTEVRLISLAGAVRLDKLIAKQTEDSWAVLACVDRLVELGDLIEVKRQDKTSRHRIFTRATT